MQLREIVESHITRSLQEMRDPANFGRWENGERAREDAEKIAALALAEYIKALEQGKAK